MYTRTFALEFSVRYCVELAVCDVGSIVTKNRVTWTVCAKPNDATNVLSLGPIPTRDPFTYQIGVDAVDGTSVEQLIEKPRGTYVVLQDMRGPH